MGENLVTLLILAGITAGAFFILREKPKTVAEIENDKWFQDKLGFESAAQFEEFQVAQVNAGIPPATGAVRHGGGGARVG